jgi:release factor glutamine methyltransferase
MAATTDQRPAVVPDVTVDALLHDLTVRLTEAGTVERPDIEARELLVALLDVQRWWPTLNRAAAVGSELRRRALAAAAKRARGAPRAYCVGKAAFRHMTLEVDERVLIPRPETEQLVDVAMAAIGPATGGTVVDVGTGSGAIALAFASEGRFDRIIATDVSLDALAVARSNADLVRGALRSPVEFYHGSLLAPVSSLHARLIVSNPPYVAAREATDLPPSVRDWEPPVALFSGCDGLTATVRLVRQAPARLLPGGALALETDSRRAGTVADLVKGDPRFTDVRVIKDLAGLDRFVVARRKEDG